jgi:hypothetical protein
MRSYSTSTSPFILSSALYFLASVGSDDISKEAYLKEFDAAKRRMQQELGKNYTAETDHRIKLTTIRSQVHSF